MRFIPTKVHAVLDYVVAIALILAPTIFMFEEVGGAAVIIPRILGVGLILYSLFTRYELGLVKVIGMPVHLVFDIVASVFLIASPFLFGFINEAPNAWLPHIVVGVAVILVVLCSKSQPGASVTGSKAHASSVA
ncbi:SPW repeat domain-containing protein [Cryobacterium soli]|uniref:SPW repeat domain-containing protein n=1 Tax=Cryobacterium soli TaxID=2220095 RepID=UPI000E75E34F|nr:SPW repeat protein [Cryobacterium soli]